MLNGFLSSIYIRYVTVILLSFELLFVGMDYMGAAHSLPDSANLRLLYAMHIGLGAFKITLPISVVFGVIVAKIHMIRKNELIAIYSLGADKIEALKPFVIISFVVITLFVVLQGNFFYDSKEQSSAIIKNKYFHSDSKNLFLKYDNSYVYIKNLSPILKRAETIEIFELKEKELVRKISAKKGFFINNSWLLYDVKVVNKPVVNGIQQEGITINNLETMRALVGFKPSVMDTVHDGKTTLSFYETLSAFILLFEQDISTDKIRGVFYSNYLSPYFSVLMVVIIFFMVPISVRFFNLALFSSVAVFTTLAGWGVIFTISQLAISGTLNPELAIVFPFLVTLSVTGYLIKKNI